MAEAHEYGRPVLRTLFYEFPQDAACWEVEDQYMFGDALLVAPCTSWASASGRSTCPPGRNGPTCALAPITQGARPFRRPRP